jgi:hypothetical protein
MTRQELIEAFKKSERVYFIEREWASSRISRALIYSIYCIEWYMFDYIRECCDVAIIDEKQNKHLFDKDTIQNIYSSLLEAECALYTHKMEVAKTLPNEYSKYEFLEIRPHNKQYPGFKCSNCLYCTRRSKNCKKHKLPVCGDSICPLHKAKDYNKEG